MPAQLPGDVTAFTGRADELAGLDLLLAETSESTSQHGHSGMSGAGEADRMAAQSSAVVIAVVSGTAGVGKTALAVHWARQAAGAFPDGQLYVNLRGYDPGQPVLPADALAKSATGTSRLARTPASARHWASSATLAWLSSTGNVPWTSTRNLVPPRPRTQAPGSPRWTKEIPMTWITETW